MMLYQIKSNSILFRYMIPETTLTKPDFIKLNYTEKNT